MLDMYVQLGIEKSDLEQVQVQSVPAQPTNGWVTISGLNPDLYALIFVVNKNMCENSRGFSLDVPRIFYVHLVLWCISSVFLLICFLCSTM